MTTEQNEIKSAEWRKKNLSKNSSLANVSGSLYAFLYNSCIHESSWATVSLHYSKEGAEKAMQEHKQKKLDEFNEMYTIDNEFGFKFGEHEVWYRLQSHNVFDLFPINFGGQPMFNTNVMFDDEALS